VANAKFKFVVSNARKGYRDGSSGRHGARWELAIVPPGIFLLEG
jgi:hypothetical protein